MLHESIVGVLPAQGDQILVVQVKVVDAADQSGSALLLKGVCERRDQGRLAGALDAVEANDERARCGVGFELLEDEGHADGGLIIYE